MEKEKNIDCFDEKFVKLDAKGKIKRKIANSYSFHDESIWRIFAYQIPFYCLPYKFLQKYNFHLG